MRRNPELAAKVTEIPEVERARYNAIDKITAAHLAVSMLAKQKDSDPVKMLETEEKAIEYMEDAVYTFRKYLRLKKNIYDGLVHESMERGNQIMKDTIQLAKERGLDDRIN